MARLPEDATKEADFDVAEVQTEEESSFGVALAQVGLDVEDKSLKVYGLTSMGERSTFEEAVSICGSAVLVLERRLQMLESSTGGYTCGIGATAFEQQPSCQMPLRRELAHVLEPQMVKR